MPMTELGVLVGAFGGILISLPLGVYGGVLITNGRFLFGGMCLLLAIGAGFCSTIGILFGFDFWNLWRWL